jgi:hypothetical protein
MSYQTTFETNVQELYDEAVKHFRGFETELGQKEFREYVVPNLYKPQIDLYWQGLAHKPTVQVDQLKQFLHQHYVVGGRVLKVI